MRRQPHDHLGGPSARTVAVLSGLLKGLSNIEIARRTGIAPRMVAFYVSALLKMFAVESRAALVARVTLHGMPPAKVKRRQPGGERSRQRIKIVDLVGAE